MILTYRAAAAALILGAASLVGASGANAATVGNFSPLKTATIGATGGVELAYYGGHRHRCFRDCRIGHHGRTYCSWTCYRPHRWW